MRTPTSATPADPAARRPAAVAPTAAAGFTLIELIVALAVVGVLLAVVPVAIDRAGESLGYRAAVQGVVASLRQARHAAMASGAPAAFVIAPAARRYGVEGQPSESISDRLEVSATTAAALAREQGVQRIVFMPDGSSSGGSVQILRASGQGVRLRVDWLLGRITHEPPQS